MVLAWFVSNSAEALIGAWGVRRYIERPVQFDTFRRVGVFVVFAAILAPFLSSFLDAAFVMWNGWGTSTYWEVWRVRFFSNVLAILTLVPVIVTWGPEICDRCDPLRGGESSRRVCSPAVSWSSARSCSRVRIWRCAVSGAVVRSVTVSPVGGRAIRASWGKRLPARLRRAVGLGSDPWPGSVRRPLGRRQRARPAAVPDRHLYPAHGARGDDSRARHPESEARRSGEWLNLALGAGQSGAWDWDHPAGQRDVVQSTNKLFGVGVDGNSKINRRAFSRPWSSMIGDHPVRDREGHREQRAVRGRVSNGSARRDDSLDVGQGDRGPRQGRPRASHARRQHRRHRAKIRRGGAAKRRGASPERGASSRPRRRDAAGRVHCGAGRRARLLQPQVVRAHRDARRPGR